MLFQVKMPWIGDLGQSQLYELCSKLDFEIHVDNTKDWFDCYLIQVEKMHQ